MASRTQHRPFQRNFIMGTLPGLNQYCAHHPFLALVGIAVTLVGLDPVGHLTKKTNSMLT